MIESHGYAKSKVAQPPRTRHGSPTSPTTRSFTWSGRLLTLVLALLLIAALTPTFAYDEEGIPFYDPEARIARWAPPEFLPREGRGILFLDELNAAPPAVQPDSTSTTVSPWRCPVPSGHSPAAPLRSRSGGRTVAERQTSVNGKSIGVL